MSIFFSLQREETLKQKKELSQELANLRDELGKNVRPPPAACSFASFSLCPSHLHTTHTRTKLIKDGTTAIQSGAVTSVQLLLVLRKKRDASTQAVTCQHVRQVLGAPVFSGGVLHGYTRSQRRAAGSS